MEYGTPNSIRAKQFATVAHGIQSYADEVPYVVHLEMVAAVMQRFGETRETMLCAAYLHDTIEDTGRSYNDIAKRFGKEVAELVYAVTNELGRNRKEKAIKTYPKIREAGADAIRLKLCDRIANVEYGMANGGKNDMYAKEYNDFRAALFVEGDGNAQYFAYLDKLMGYVAA